MDDKTNKELRGLLAFIAMALIGAALVVLFGELVKHFVPSDLLYFSVINHIYILAAAALLLFIGLGGTGLAHIRNLTAFFVVMVILAAVAYELDQVASGMMTGSAGLLIARVPDHYASLFLTAIDGISLVLGAVGAFMLLWKGLDKLKDVLSGASKSS